MADKTGLMDSQEFTSFFRKALTDEKFRSELLHDGFGALERSGFAAPIDPEIRSLLAQQLSSPEPAAGEGGFVSMLPAKPRCGVCGVCGICGLCGEINAGSASAALWALFGLA